MRGSSTDNDALLHVLEHTRQLRDGLNVSRLERMLVIYRTWVTSPQCFGLDGGFSVTEDELACILEYPSNPEHFRYLMGTFCVCEAPSPRLDLLTLLAACTCLAQGSLEAKARFLFHLVDLDTEDEIVEDELAMLISLCSDGLRRMGILITELEDADAKAIAWEAFDFVGIEDGDKMTFAAFAKWLIAHPRPAALFTRLQSVLLLSTMARRLHEALNHQVEAKQNDPFCIYNDAHFEDDEARGVHARRMVVGPIVGPVTTNEVRMLVELSDDAIVQCFAFPVEKTESSMSEARVVEVAAKANEPVLVIVSDLAPSKTYHFRFLGICRRDRERCVAIATTTRSPEDDVSMEEQELWKLRILNHSGANADQGVTSKLNEQCHIAADENASVLTVHLSCIHVDERMVAILLRLLESGVERDRIRARKVLSDRFRSCLQRESLRDLLRYQSNLVFSSMQKIFCTPHTVDETMMLELYAMVLVPWHMYIGSLWGLDADSSVNVVHYENSSLLLCGGDEGLLKLEENLHALQAIQAAIVITDHPVIPRRVDSTEEMDAVLTKLMPIIEWKRHHLQATVCLLSQDQSGGYHTQLAVKNTMISIPQLVCGPARGCDDDQTPQASFPEHSLASVVSVSATSVPHFVDIRCYLAPPPSRPGSKAISSRPTNQASISRPTSSQASSSRPSTRGSSNGDRAIQHTQLVCSMLPVFERSSVSLLVGPIVSTLTSISAMITIQSDCGGPVTIRLMNKLTGESLERRVSAPAHGPSQLLFSPLQPNQQYSVIVKDKVCGYFHTLSASPASLRVLVIGDDRFSDDFRVQSRPWMNHETATSVLGSILDNMSLLSPRADPLYDLTIQIGSSTSLRHDLMGGLRLLNDPGEPDESTSEAGGFQLLQMVRKCFQVHASIPDWTSLRSKSGWIFTHLGLLSKLMQSGAPRRLLHAVRAVIQEYEQNGVRDASEVKEPGVIHPIGTHTVLVVLDSMDWLRDTCSTQYGFADWPETLLTTRQLDGLKRSLGSSGPKKSAMSRQVIVLCDAPFLWPYEIESRRRRHDLITHIAANPWAHYTQDVRRLLETIFEAMQQDPLLRVTLLASGSCSSRLVVSSKRYGHSIEQLTVGPISNLGSEPDSAVPKPDVNALSGVLTEAFTFRSFEADTSTLAPKQYCLLDVVPHQRGASYLHTFYTAEKPDAKIIVGPVIGKVLSRAARILIEVDRRVAKASCVLIATSGSTHKVVVESSLEAFTPTIFKVEGLHASTRYKVHFEGLMIDKGVECAYIETLPQVHLTAEWFVFSSNNLRSLLPVKVKATHSHWQRILAPGTRYYQAQAASHVAVQNGDLLGSAIDTKDEDYNPWHHVEAHGLSKPLRQPQLCVHLGGQVDLSTAFTEEELRTLVLRLTAADTDEVTKRELYEMVRFRMQDVYRITWGTTPMNTMLGYGSHVMLLNEAADVFFSVGRVREILSRGSAVVEYPSEDQIAAISMKLRGLAFELWQLYQNQLWVDANESDLDNSRRNSSKFAHFTAFGMCHMAFLNVSDELRGILSNSSDAGQATPTPNVNIAPLALPVATGDSPPLLLLSSASWKSLEEALEIDSSDSKTEKKAKAVSTFKHFVLCVPVDLVDLVARVPAVRSDVVRLFEKLFQWKKMNRKERSVSLVCTSEATCSTTIVVTDQKINETLPLHRISSIAAPNVPPSASTSSSKQKKKAAGKEIVKGYFSKRFTYASTTPLHGGPPGTKYRSYAKFQFLSDYRRCVVDDAVLLFPALTLPKMVLGPVIGRLVASDESSNEAEAIVTFSVPILVEVNASGRVTCVVIDSMNNTEIRVSSDLQAHVPHVFCVHGLTPLRRYLCSFEGVSNGEDRRGSFHTPPVERARLNLIVVSSSFPTHMEVDRDSLWVPLLERAKIPWCGIDALVHLGGQVPLHEAAIECYEYASRELDKEILHGDRTALAARRLQRVRAKVRRRFQQEYHTYWNLPVSRELLACASHWFIPGKADVAPIYGYEGLGVVEASQAARLVLEVASDIVQEYQLKLMTAIDEEKRERVDQDPESKMDTRDPRDTGTNAAAAAQKDHASDERAPDHRKEEANSGVVDEQATEEKPEPDGVIDSGGAVYWQHRELAVFTCDTRSASLPRAKDDDAIPITCHGRLAKPLSRQENAIMDEQQWLYLETALRKKHTLLFILCLELPLILTDALYVDKLRDDLRSRPQDTDPWNRYDHKTVTQHYVSCKRQLEQLLLILFKWKAKRAGRDVLVLSGNMRVGIETLVQDRETKLSIRNLTVGPVTARVEPFEFPLSGIACPTFAGGLKDDHFTFHHALQSDKNYLLLEASIAEEASGRTALVQAQFVSATDPAILNRVHSVDMCQRFPQWWTQYIPMGQAVFWDDTITLKSETDDRMLALRAYVWQDKGFAGALEVFYEKFEFAETARLADLRSRHLQHVDLQAHFRSVLRELWKQVLPGATKQQMAYFLDPFVRDLLLDHVAPGFWHERLTFSGAPIELACFSQVVREFVFDACLLWLAIETQRDDEIEARGREMERQRREEEQRVQAQARQEVMAQEEAKRMEELLRTDPQEYATIKLAQEAAVQREREAKYQAKLAKKKAERLAELEEEQAIAKEQKKLSRLAERDPIEYDRRSEELQTRIRKLGERRAQRAAQKKTENGS